MRRARVLAAVVGLGLLSASWAGDERDKLIQEKQLELDRLRELTAKVGAKHPDLLVLKQRIEALAADVAQADTLAKGLLVVLSREGQGATLKDARIRTIAGRSFVVGVEVEGPRITRGTFAGKVVWLPLDDVRQMVELDDQAPK